LESARRVEVFLEGRGKRLEQATQADLEDFLADILRRRSANTAATRYKVMRVLYRWLEEEEELPNPMARMKPPIIPEQPIPIVPNDGLRRLLAACAGKGFEARRDTAIIMLLLDTGARRAELIARQRAYKVRSERARHASIAASKAAWSPWARKASRATARSLSGSAMAKVIARSVRRSVRVTACPATASHHRPRPGSGRCRRRPRPRARPAW
jgi:site-specific recombinase XerC